MPSNEISVNEQWILAESYRKIHNYDLALQNYEQLDLAELPNDSAHLFFALVLEESGLYKRANEHFTLFNNRHPNDAISQRHIHANQNLNMLSKNKELKIELFALSTQENDFVGFIKDSALVMASSGMKDSKKVYQWDGQHFLNLKMKRYQI